MYLQSITRIHVVVFRLKKTSKRWNKIAKKNIEHGKTILLSHSSLITS